MHGPNRNGNSLPGLGCTLLAAAVGILLALAGCKSDAPATRAETQTPEPEQRAPASEAEQTAKAGGVEPAEVVDLPDEPKASASSEFWEHWGDGNAELASYTGEVMRYGEPREARVVLIYVTEPHDRRTWVKNDDAEAPHRVNVMKLNHVLKFQTGIYPYSVMTSVFAPVDDWGRPRFQPTKISLTAQEWCGHVFHGIWPGDDRFLDAMHSYFAGEGDRRRAVDTPDDTLYQDALLVQLRELDGKFNDGEDWKGHLVPSLWNGRRSHTDLKPVSATIDRKETEVDDQQAVRFVLTYNGRIVTYDVAAKPPHHILQWKSSEGSRFELVETERLPYWKLNRPGDEEERTKLNLPKEW